MNKLLLHSRNKGSRLYCYVNKDVHRIIIKWWGVLDDFKSNTCKVAILLCMQNADLPYLLFLKYFYSQYQEQGFYFSDLLVESDHVFPMFF